MDGLIHKFRELGPRSVTWCSIVGIDPEANALQDDVVPLRECVNCANAVRLEARSQPFRPHEVVEALHLAAGHLEMSGEFSDCAIDKAAFLIRMIASMEEKEIEGRGNDEG